MKNILMTTGHEPLLENITRAKGAWVYNHSGKKYLDLESGVWCTSLGHSDAKWIRNINRQIRKISHTGFVYYNPLIEKAAGKILNITGLNGGKCVFLCSGSEAVEFGVSLMVNLVGKRKILTFPDSYFGSYGFAATRPGNLFYHFDWFKCSDCQTDQENCFFCPEFRIIPFAEIGGFLFEPGSSSGLVRFPGKKLIKSIENKIRENKGLIVCNEVTTGIGRTGKWFGYNHYDLKPDMVAMGKGIGNGFPVSVLAVSASVAEKAGQIHFHYSQSHQNDVLGASVALCVLNEIEKKELIEKSEELSVWFINALKKLKSKYPVIRDIRSRGMMIALEFDDSEIKDIARIIYGKLFENNILVCLRQNTPVIRIDPPLSITKKELELFAETFEKCLQF